MLDMLLGGQFDGNWSMGLRGGGLVEIMVLGIRNVSIVIIIRWQRVDYVEGAACGKPSLSSRESWCEFHFDDTELSMAVSLSVEKKIRKFAERSGKKKFSMLRLCGRSFRGFLTCNDKTMVCLFDTLGRSSR